MKSNYLQSNKILITGSSGFIGENLLRKIDKKKENFRLLVRNTSREGKKEITGNLMDKKSLEEITNKNSFDSIIHLAAFFPKNQEEINDFSNIKINFYGTINLFESFKNNLKSFIFISSVDVYGNTKKLPIKESSKKCPQNLYAMSKSLAEDYLINSCEKNDVNLTILRLSHVYGPKETPGKVIPCFINKVISNESPIIYGDGSDVRDYVYIDDVVNAIILSIEKNKEGVYNIASGNGINMKELAEKIIQISGKKLRPMFLPKKNSGRKIVLDIEKAVNDLSYSPKTELESGLKKEIDYFTRLLK